MSRQEIFFSLKIAGSCGWLSPIHSPPVRWGLLDFMSAVPPPPAASSSSCSSASAGPQLQVLDRSGPRRTRTANPGSEWSLPDLNHKEFPKRYQIECQKECQKIYQIESQEEEEERTTLMKSKCHQSCPLLLFPARKSCQKNARIYAR